MSNRLPSMRTLPVPSQVEARISELRGRLEAVDGQPTRFCVPRARAATIPERTALSRVAERVEAELQPCRNRKHVDVVVTRVLAGFEQGRGRSDEEGDVIVAEYVEALEGLPLAAVQSAASRFRAKTTILRWDPAWRPTPGQFAAETREGLIPLRAKFIHIRQILDAEVYDPPTEADRAKVQAAASSWLKRDGGPEDGRTAPRAETVAAPMADVDETRSRFAVAAGGGDLSRLMDRLDAKAPRQGAEVGA